MGLLEHFLKPAIIIFMTFSAGCSIVPFSSNHINQNIESADLILRDGEVYTVDADRPWAEAVAVKDGKIVYVGSNAGVIKHGGPNTRVVILDGKMVLPGFQDAHVHPIEAGMAYLGCSLHDGKSVEEYVHIVEECAKQSPEATFIDGGGWTMDLFEDGLPDKRLLDEVVSDRPVILKSASGHQLWVNSKTLDIAGIDAETPNPPRGRIDRYKNSREPSGSLQENSAMNLAFNTRPAYSASQMQAALKFGQHYLNQYGVTTVQDALLKLDGNEAYVGGPTYMEMDQAGDLTIRVVGALVWNTELGMEQLSRITDAREQFKTPLFSVPSVKIWLDGVMEVHTAALLVPYSDREDGYSGELLIKPEQLDTVVSQLDALGFQIHFHAIGDAAVRQSLDSLELARQVNGVRDSRHHMSHIQLFDPADIPRLESLNVVANFQPYWAWADKFITELTIPKLGAERSKWLYPIKSVLDTGAVVAFGSDWFVTSGNPLLGIETAVTRRDPLTNISDPFLESERISLADAIEAYTINSAYVNFIDDETGSIEKGKVADLIVLDKNLFELAPNEISDAQVLLTLLEGKPVYGDWTLSSIPKTAQ